MNDARSRLQLVFAPHTSASRRPDLNLAVLHTNEAAGGGGRRSSPQGGAFQVRWTVDRHDKTDLPCKEDEDVSMALGDVDLPASRIDSAGRQKAGRLKARTTEERNPPGRHLQAIR